MQPLIVMLGSALALLFWVIARMVAHYLHRGA